MSTEYLSDFVVATPAEAGDMKATPASSMMSVQYRVVDENLGSAEALKEIRGDIKVLKFFRNNANKKAIV